MLISQEQSSALLAQGMIEKIHALFNKYGFTQPRLFKPQLSDQIGKINLIVKDNNDNDYYTISRVKHKLKEVLGRDDIDFLVEDNIDEDIKPIVLTHTLVFSREEIAKLVAYNISSQENAEEVIITVRIKKEPGVNYNLKQLIDTFEIATGNELEDKLTSIIKAH